MSNDGFGFAMYGAPPMVPGGPREADIPRMDIPPLFVPSIEGEVSRLGRENERLQREYAAMFDNLTTTQARCTELTLQLREAKERLSSVQGNDEADGRVSDAIRKLLKTLVMARRFHPEGANLRALVEEVGEVARAEADHLAAPNNGPKIDRFHDELVDVIVVALRMWIGEVTK